MREPVAKEYRTLIDEKQALELELLSLPMGYISKKIIKGNVQHYLQRRKGKKVISAYIRNEEVATVSAKLERRKAIDSELVTIDNRVTQLEQAAELIDKNLLCQLLMYKLSAGMDQLSSAEKEKCSSFGHAMNAIEGVSVSKETNNAIDAWKNGSISFLTAFEDTLKRYGFPLEEP